MVKVPWDDAKNLQDPVRLARILWPGVRFYAKQQEILASTVHSDETFVVAGNMLGCYPRPD